MKPALGVCYYPEQWPETMWPSDVRRMAEAGITYVRIGEFAWSRIEPEPGKLRFDWLTRVLDLFEQNGLKAVVGTPTATPPRWLVAKMPDMLQVDAEGRTRSFGSRRHYCFSHKGYRLECVRIATLVAKAVKDHPALAAWQIDNEYGCHDTTLSYSQAALAGFREWLAARYGAIEALNSAWGTVFWSMDYRDFDEIELPNRTPAEASPTHWLDFRRYSSDQVVAFNKAQVDVLKSITPNVPVSTNFMAGMTAFDHFRLGQDIDIATWDSYPVGQIMGRGGSPARKARYARQGDPDLQAFHHDLYRSVGNGRAWVMEQQPGPVNWAAHNPDPLPGMVRLWTWEAFAHGLATVSYFRWRQAPFAQEQMHAGLIRPDDRPAPGLAEARQVADELALMDVRSAGKADCAIVFDYESAWAWAIEPQAEGFSHFQAAALQYRQLRRLGLNVDIVSAEADFSGYKLVFVPALFSWTPTLTEALSRADGLVVVGPRSGSKTKDFHIPAGLPPDLPSQLLDVKVVRVDSLPDELPLPVKGGGHVHKWRDKIETSAEVLLEAEDGWPVLVGRERFFYLAALLDDDAHQKVTRMLVERAGLSTIDLPSGVRTRRTDDVIFIFNYGPETHDLAALGFKGPFGLDGATLGGAGVATALGLRSRNRSGEKPLHHGAKTLTDRIAAIMVAALHQLLPAHPDTIDRRLARRENPGVEDPVAETPFECGVITGERHDVGRGADRNPRPALAERLRAAGHCRVVERSPGGLVRTAHAIARAVAKTLRIFKLAKLRRRIDQHVGIGADTERPARLQEQPAVEHAVTEIGLGDRAQADRRAARGERRRLRIRHVRGVDQAPARVDIGVVEKPFHRALSEDRERGFDLLHLLRRVDMERRAARRECGEPFQLFRRDGAQAVRGHADIGAIESISRRAACGEEAGKAVAIAHEAPLTCVRRRAAEIRVRIEDREQRHADAGRVGRRKHADRHLGEVVIGRAVDIVMQVVEFADARETGFEHLGVKLRGDGFHVVGRHGKRHAIHRLAPRPEIVSAAICIFARVLRQAGHRALEGVAVDVRHAGEPDRVPLLGAIGRSAVRDRRDHAVGDLDANVVAPAFRQERRPEMQDGLRHLQPRMPGRSSPLSRAQSSAMS